jgi:predicted transcriptional regulator
MKRRSKLETYVEILEVLVHCGPLKPTHVMCKSNLNFNLLKGYLGFLIKQGMVNEKITRKGRKFYSITEQGITVLKYFRHLVEVLPIVEETSDKTKHQRPYLF